MQWRWTARTVHEDLGQGVLHVRPASHPGDVLRLPAALRWVPAGLVRGVHVSDLSPASPTTETLREVIARLAEIGAVEPAAEAIRPAPTVWVHAPHPVAGLLAGMLDLSGGSAVPAGTLEGQALVAAWSGACDPDLIALAASRALPVTGIALLDGAALVSPVAAPGGPCPRCLDLSLNAPAGAARIARVTAARAGALDPTLVDVRAAASALSRVQAALAGTAASEGGRPFLVQGHDERDDAVLEPLVRHPRCEACTPLAA